MPSFLDLRRSYHCTHTHTRTHIHANIHRHTHTHIHLLPVVPHKVVAEVSKIGRYRRGELLRWMDGRANPLMDGKVVGVVPFGVLAMVAVVTSPTAAGCSVL